jgi:tetratricopeptide (TPR) repeat protein
MATNSRIFLSHSHEDNTWCRQFVEGLRQIGADIWYDEHNLGYGVLQDTIDRQLRDRATFIVILTPASTGSPWVRLEMDAAMRLQHKEPERIILPVIAETCEMPLLWGAYKYVSGPDDSGLAVAEAVARVVHALRLRTFATTNGANASKTVEETDPGSPANTISPSNLTQSQPVVVSTETARDAFERGAYLRQQGLLAAALDAFELAVKLDPNWHDAWLQCGHLLAEKQELQEALAAYDHAIDIDPWSSAALSGKAIVLRRLNRYEDARAAVMAVQVSEGKKRRRDQ